MKTIVKFIKPWAIYSPGDVTGFDAERAESLVNAGIVEAVKAESTKAESKVEPKAGKQ
jgi:hypothetical protein